MQVWDQVKVVSGAYEGKAGVVQAVNEGMATVKLDEVAEPVMLAAEDLVLLGR